MNNTNKTEKFSGQKRGMVLIVGENSRKIWGMVGNVCIVQGPSPNMYKIAHKSEKIGGWCSLLVMMLRNISRIEMFKFGNLFKNSKTITKKIGSK